MRERGSEGEKKSQRASERQIERASKKINP